MKTLFVSTLLALCVSSAYATNKPPANECGNHGNNCNTPKPAKPVKPTKPVVKPEVVVSTTPINVTTPVNVEAATPASVSVGVASSPFQNQTVNINEATAPTKTESKIRNTGDAFGYAAPPSAVCALTGGAGMALPGFGASVSGSSIDKGCEARENARMLMQMGQEIPAIRVLCRNNEDVAREIPICGDIVKLHEEKARRSTAPASNFGIVN